MTVIWKINMMTIMMDTIAKSSWKMNAHRMNNSSRNRISGSISRVSISHNSNNSMACKKKENYTMINRMIMMLDMLMVMISNGIMSYKKSNRDS